MDSLTHLLVGHAMGVAASGAAHPHGSAAYWAVLIGNSLPDIDVPLSLLLGRGIKLHRTITHTLPGAAALSALTALVLGSFFPGTPFGLIFGWTMLGSLAHMALDCLNLFGARPFWPLSSLSINLGVLHILDPFLLALLGTAALAVATGLTGTWVLTLSFALIWPYVLYRIWSARQLYHRLKRAGSSRARVIPWFNSWRYVFETATAIEFGHLDGGKLRSVKRWAKLDHPLVQATLTNPKVARFLQSAEYPYAIVEEDENGPLVVWGDALRQIRLDFQPLRVRVEE
ncbi:MAG TPA: metal-dependent hydrolase [Symbiobacteriaceae bacterium]|nr:metal-dependent hydrolase [Symbiobacteriaceae bacterium]